MHQTFGALDGGRVLGGLLMASMTVRGAWITRDAAFDALAVGRTSRIVIPEGGTAAAAFAAGIGTTSVEVRPAQIAARLHGAHPSQVRYDGIWLRRILAAEHVRPVPGDVHWFIAEDGVIEAWVPVRAARHPDGRRPACFR